MHFDSVELRPDLDDVAAAQSTVCKVLVNLRMIGGKLSDPDQWNSLNFGAW